MRSDAGALARMNRLENASSHRVGAGFLDSVEQ